MNAINLDLKLRELVKTERRITAEVISVITEIDRCKLFLKFGFNSMFAYLTEGLKYSPTAAMRRLNASRLARHVEGVEEKIKSGSLNLTTLAIAAQAIRQKEKINATNHQPAKLTSEEKINLIEKLENKKEKEVQILVAKELDLPVVMNEKKVMQKDGSMRLEITCTTEQQKLFETVRQLMSHKNPNPTWIELFEELANFFVARKVLSKPLNREKKLFEANTPPERKCTTVPAGTNGQRAEMTVPSTGLKEKTTTHYISNRYVPRGTKRIIFERDNCCQWVDKKTGKQCNSKHQLEIDHIKPVWAGGDNGVDNLRLLCSAHNKLKYRNEAQIRLL